jgi:hypothetical protein
VLGPVFRTYEPTRDRLVAVKVFRLDVTPEQAQVLADELAHAAEAELFHPAIVEPIASGVEGTIAYRAEEYVAAESLDVAMRHYAPASFDTTIRIVSQLAEAVDAARASGVGHGALHPRDIFVTPDEARASGFGVVDALERCGLRAPVRRPYSAPERVAGRDWSTPADIFSLAVVTFELLTGRRPAGTGSAIGPLTGARVDNAEAIQAVVARALHEDPAQRFETARAFATALTEAAGTQSTISEPPAFADESRPEFPMIGIPTEAPVFADEDDPIAEVPAAEPPVLEPPVAGATPASVGAPDAERTPIIVPPTEAAESAAVPQPVLDRTLALDPGRHRAPADDADSRDEEGEPADFAIHHADESHDAAEHGRDWALTPDPVADASGPAFDPAIDTVPEPAASSDPQLISAPMFGAIERAPKFGAIGAIKEEPEGAPPEPTSRRYDELEPAAPADTLALGAAGLALNEAQAHPARPAAARPPADLSSADHRPAVFEETPPQIIERDPRPYRGPDDHVPFESLALESEPAPRSRWPLAAMLLLGLLIGFGAGYVVVKRDRQTGGSAAVTGSGSAAPAGEPVSGAPSAAGATPTPVDRPTPPAAAKGPATGRASAPPARGRSEAATPPAPRAGTLVVNSTPTGAGVTLNGKWLGRTPLTLTSLPFGTYTVRVVQPGFRPKPEQVTLSAQAASRTLTVQLEPVPAQRGAGGTPAPAEPPGRGASEAAAGALDVDSRPVGARVFVDDRPVGTTPLHLPDVAPGNHVVRMELPNFETWSGTAQVSRGKATRVAGSLEPIR